MMTTVVYTVRRALLILLAFFFKGSSTIQLLLAYLINFLGSVFFMHVSPHQEQLLNKIEIVNEVTILMVNVHLFCFTEFVENVEKRTLSSHSMILFILVNGLFNFYFCAKSSGFGLALIIKKLYNRLCSCLGFHDSLTYTNPPS